MGHQSIVRPMGHGPGNCRTTHGSWATKVSYDPWAMDQTIVVRSMGHGPDNCRTTHGSWATNSVVRHRMAHGSWAIVMSYGPWVMGKKSLKGVSRPAHGGGARGSLTARPFSQYSTSSRLSSVESIATIVDEKQNSPLNKSNEAIRDSFIMHDSHILITLSSLLVHGCGRWCDSRFRC